MIPRTKPACQAFSAVPESWQQALANMIREPAELWSLLQLDPALLPSIEAACKQFPLRVPRSFVSRMELGNPNDPLLLQVLPQNRELDVQPGFSTDPLEEAASQPAPGLIHKYQGRVLLILSGACAIHCRYCFRRHFPYADNKPGRQSWQQALDYIAQNQSITELILSGGDPLSTNNQLLTELIVAAESIPHLQRLRIHSRLPVVIPQRIDSELLQSLQHSRLQAVMVIHSNHPNEICNQVGQAIQRLIQAGVTVLNQTVLLRHINNQAEILCQLSEKLFQYGALPYYLHVLDAVEGAAHFNIDDQQASELAGELTRRLPGYLVPKLVREHSGKPSKTPIPASL